MLFLRVPLVRLRVRIQARALMGSELAGQPQSWRDLGPIAKGFVAPVVSRGRGGLFNGPINQSSRNIAEFICYLGIAILASRLKVNLPGITGTLSVNFLFILIGVLELSFTETLILGGISMLAQCFYPERPRTLQVAFNVCAGSISTALAYIVYHLPVMNLILPNHPIL